MFNDEKINPFVLQMQSKQKMKEGHKALKKKLGQITGETRSAREVMSEALSGVSNDHMQHVLSGSMYKVKTHAINDIMYGNSSNPVAQIAEHQARNMPYTTGGMNPVVHGDWQIQTLLKETSGGKEVERFRVTNSSTGKKFDYTFRYGQAAQMVAAALNESNNVKDPRVTQIINWCQKEESIMMETAKMVQHYKQLDPGNVKRRGILKNQISEKKLMLEGIRSKLGVL